MWMPLVDVPAEMGTMTFASGSERGGYLAAKEISDESEAYYDAYVAERGFPLVTHGAMAAGDATFHSGYTLHRAPGNPTDRVREVMTIIYFPDGTLVIEPDSEWRAVDKRVFLDDLPGGAMAAGPLNPLLYP